MKLSLFSLITLFSTVMCACATGKFHDGNQCITKKNEGDTCKENLWCKSGLECRDKICTVHSAPCEGRITKCDGKDILKCDIQKGKLVKEKTCEHGCKSSEQRSWCKCGGDGCAIELRGVFQNCFEGVYMTQTCNKPECVCKK